MTFPVHSFGDSVKVSAEPSGLVVRGPRDLSIRENWPPVSLTASGGWRTAVEVEQLLELGFAEGKDGAILVPYENFQAIQEEIPVHLITAWTAHSPFLLKIDRKSDLGRPDFQYRYSFLLAGRQVEVQRLGYYVKRSTNADVFLLDAQMYSLVQAMDQFNALPPEAKTPQESWLAFAKVKGCAAEVGATLDSTLRNNDVIVPSALGLDVREDEEGALTFLPNCAELADEEFHQVFERNNSAEKLYSIDRPGLGRVRIVLSDGQHEVLRRMKRVRRVKGEVKERLQRDPVRVFDGVADEVKLPGEVDPPGQVDLPYGQRVTGIGNFTFAPSPRADSSGSEMAELWRDSVRRGDSPVDSSEENVNNPPGELEQPGSPSGSLSPNSAQGGPAEHQVSGGAEQPNGANSSAEQGDSAHHSDPKYLLIKTNEEDVDDEGSSQAENPQLSPVVPYERPQALRSDRPLRPHQETGFQWLQTCAQIPGRKGVLLADDMGVGKTIQILAFLAWCIESGKYPGLSKPEPPFRPILIVAPLILLDTQTWEREMESFFEKKGVVFWPVLSLHGEQLARFRLRDVSGSEVDIGRPALDLDKIQRHRVVITNYDTLKNYQHSFAYIKDGKPVWSIVVSDEAQEYKVPNTRLSHAIKAMESDFHISCTGTPVENRLLDLWNLSDVFQPLLLGSAKAFVDQFEKVQAGTTQDQTLEVLKKKLLFHSKTNAFLLRRTKSDVANLPDKKIIKIDCDMSEQEIASHQFLLQSLRSEKGGTNTFLSTLHRFAQLYQHPALLESDPEDKSSGDLIAQSSKLRKVLAKLHEIRARREKAIVFARHRAMQGILAKVFQQEFRLPVRIINGETKMKAGSLKAPGIKTRNAILDDFRASPGFNILILSPFVAGIGLTIVEANHVFHYGRWWNPAVESQATDRAYRIGQEREVFVYLPILRDPSKRIPLTFDEGLDLLMDRKQRLADDFLRPLPPEDEIGRELFTELAAGGEKSDRAASSGVPDSRS